MGFVPLQIISQPPWDAQTDETVLTFGIGGNQSYTVPYQCEHIIVSVDAIVDVFMSSDDTDLDSGLLFGANASDPRISMPVVPGTVIEFNATAAVLVNIVQFYNRANP